MEYDLNRKDAKITKIAKGIEDGAVADPWSRVVIGAAIAVHRALGPGFLESVYEEALCIELQERGVPFQRQVPVTIFYRGHIVGEGIIDVLVGKTLVVELKAIDAFAPIHIAQVMSYHQALDQPLGLLINFKVPVLGQGGLKRVIRS